MLLILNRMTNHYVPESTVSVHVMKGATEVCCTVIVVVTVCMCNGIITCLVIFFMGAPTCLLSISSSLMDHVIWFTQAFFSYHSLCYEAMEPLILLPLSEMRCGQLPKYNHAIGHTLRTILLQNAISISVWIQSVAKNNSILEILQSHQLALYSTGSILVLCR